MAYDAAILQKAKKVKLAIFDVDGVFTDGKIFLHDNGTEHTGFHIRDGLGLVMLQNSKIGVAIISGRNSAVTRERMSYLNIKDCHLGVGNKKQVLENILQVQNLEGEQLCYTGDDLVDIEAMRASGLAVAVADAHPLVKQAAHWTTGVNGGQGAVREVCELLLHAHGYSDDDLIAMACNK